MYIVRQYLHDGHGSYSEQRFEDLAGIREWFNKYITDKFWIRTDVPKISVEVRIA